MVNIAKLLKGCPKGTKLYSPLFGEVKFKYIDDIKFGIIVEDSKECCRSFDKYGRYFTIYDNAECLLFPSKDYRTWQGWTPCIEPKFKVGDWIVRGEGFVYEPSLITEIRDYYICESQNGERVTYTLNDVHKNFHLWTIEDAQDGDVLATGNIICIFKKLDKDGYYIISPCIYTVKDGLEVIDNEDDTIGSCGFKPATKEDRNLLFRKMKEAGYEWDADKKELLKIKHYAIANFHAGMPVLVRETSLNAWQYVLFSHCYIGGDGLTRFNAGLVGFTQCIPFNDDTKHLLGTTDPCGEEYINW